MPEHDMNELLMTTRLRTLRAMTCVLLWLVVADTVAQVQLDDAERFARLMAQTAYRPSKLELQREVLTPASTAFRGLLSREGIAASQLHDALVTRRFAYRHAIELCLPAMQRISGQIEPWLAMGAEPGASRVIAVFGGGTTGGLVYEDQVVIALEVLCRFAGSPASAEQVLEAAIRHEAVHVVQLRRQNVSAKNSLLRQALIEGLADWASMRQLGKIPPQARERNAFGQEHEARLWQDFRARMYGPNLGHWMYGPGRPGEPADLGYWIGSQIVSAYMAQAGEEGPAMDALLLLESPAEILQRSGYNPVTPMEGTVPGSNHP